MRNQLFRTLVLCGACVALGAQAQSSSSTPGSSTDPSSGSSGSSSSTYPTATPGSPGSGSQSGLSGHQFSPTGRMHHEAVRSSQLTGAQIAGSTGSEIGTISDTIVNPSSGRLEFAIISLSGGSSAATSSSTTVGSATAGTSATSASPSATTSGKQVAVPWMLLRPSPSPAASAQQPSFVFMGDASKLESAPNFDATTDLSQPSWRQSVFSYFGMSGGNSATGGAETPGGSTTPQR